MEILKLDNVSFTYDKLKYVLKDIDLIFETGKMYGVFGKSGAGKSTLLSLMAGLETYKEGHIYYKGEELNQINKDKYRSNDIGVIFQSYNLLSHLTALENVILSMDISMYPNENKKEKALEYLKKVGIDSEKANRKVLQLSGGEQQRIAIARALSYNANIILADEPTGNLDRETEDDILKILDDIAHKDKKCVIIISHSMHVKENVDIVYNLVRGKIES